MSFRLIPATGVLLAAIATASLLDFLSGRQLTQLGGNHPTLVLSDGQWWRLLTSTFLHGGHLHLAVNGWALYQLGGLFEVWLGPLRLLLTYFASGLAGSLASVLFTQEWSVGASGAIFGLLGALIAFLFQRRDRLTPAARSILGQLVFWAGLNVILGFSHPQIDNAAHLGGFAAGVLAGLRLHPTR